MFTEPIVSNRLVKQRVDGFLQAIELASPADLNPRLRRESTGSDRKLLKLRNTDGY